MGGASCIRREASLLKNSGQAPGSNWRSMCGPVRRFSYRVNRLRGRERDLKPLIRFDHVLALAITDNEWCAASLHR